ncbi:hypothetical protein OROGR_012739 [Orobanche gracilis]
MRQLRLLLHSFTHPPPFTFSWIMNKSWIGLQKWDKRVMVGMKKFMQFVKEHDMGVHCTIVRVINVNVAAICIVLNLMFYGST